MRCRARAVLGTQLCIAALLCNAALLSIAALLCMAALAPGAGAAPASSPLTQLRQTRAGFASWAGGARSPAARQLIGEADIELARATAASLWIDPGHAVAPAYGTSVFADSRAALVDLEHVPDSAAPGGRLTTAEAAIAPAGVRSLAGPRPLGRDGKPEVLFVGLESCRFCAVQRWGLVVALSRFGTFSNLHLGQSATTSAPVVKSFSFAGSRYVRPYVSFEPIELFSNIPRRGGGYVPLTRLTPAQHVLVRSLDPSATSPFVDVANGFLDVGATVSPGFLGESSWVALASSLPRARSISARAIAATAEVLTTEICQATGGAPTPVCGSPVVQDYAGRLARFGGGGGGGGRGGGGGGCPIPASNPAHRRLHLRAGEQ